MSPRQLPAGVVSFRAHLIAVPRQAHYPESPAAGDVQRPGAGAMDPKRAPYSAEPHHRLAVLGGHSVLVSYPQDSRAEAAVDDSPDRLLRRARWAAHAPVQ